MIAQHVTARGTGLPARSKCANESRQQELERLRRMSIEERVRAALEMNRRFTWIKPDLAEPAR